MSCNYVKFQRFSEKLFKTCGKRRVSQFNTVFHPIGYVCAYVVKTMNVVTKGKSIVQKFVLEFKIHPLGSVLCKRKWCRVNKKDSTGSSVVQSVRESENILKTR